MRRRQFVQFAVASLAAGAAAACSSRMGGFRDSVPGAGPASATQGGRLDAAAYRATRHYADLPCGRIAYIERGAGDAALFLHGAPLNSFQWRGAIERLSPHRRCIAPDFMGLGYSEVPAGQSLQADAQTAMLAALLDQLHVAQVDIVASDSGGAVAQLFAVRYPHRVRSLLLTNCDVEPHSPPSSILPIIEMARNGTLADMTAKWLTDRALARSTFGAGVYRDPSGFTDDIIDYYIQPLVSSPLRRQQYEAYHVALAPNPLAGVEARLKRCTAPVRMVWGDSDAIFPLADAQYLDRLFPNSRGIRPVAGAKLFFQEEFPEVIAEEARRLWGVG
ncbi:alpha/beta fold hydrolase [Lysobacter tyrosinilyticus]